MNTRIIARVVVIASACLLQTGVAQAAAVYTPIPLNPSSYNHDVVVEKTATPKLVVVTTASVDQGTNNGANTWYEVGYNQANPTSGLPSPGTTFQAVSNANYSFKMPPSYTAPNGILIDTLVTSGTFTLVTPSTYALLSFLGSGGNGGDVVAATVRYADGTSQTGLFACPDWFNGTSNVAFVAYGRTSSAVNYGFDNQASNPRLYYRDIVLNNTASPVTSVDLKYSSGAASSHNAIFAMSGSATVGGPVNPITVTGYTYDFVVEATGPLRGRQVDTTGANATTQSMDNTGNTANGWYERGYNINNIGANSPNTNLAGLTGLPPAGSGVTNAAGDREYILPPSWTGPNAIYLSTVETAATITFATPTAATALSFLAAAGNGPVSPQFTVNHQDGSTETTGVQVFDWFNTTPPFIFATGGRVAVDTGQINYNANGNPRLFGIDLAIANGLSPITSVQINYTNTGGRVAIFGVSKTTGPVAPLYSSQPASVTVFGGASVSFSASVSGTVPIALQWQKGTNGVYVNLTDTGRVSGSTSSQLFINNILETDEADYRLVSTNTAGSVPSQVATLTVLSTLNDITTPGDPIVATGGSTTATEVIANAIDNTTSKWLNFDALDTVLAPFVGPVGFIITPSVGRTIISAFRIYAANDATERDPVSCVIEGSNDGGNSYTLLTFSVVSLSTARNPIALPLDPLTQSMRQVRFANTNAYTSYQVTFQNVRNNTTANSMQIGEIELLGVSDGSGFPTVAPPASVKAIEGTSATLSATIGGTPTPTVRWQKLVSGVYTTLTDGANVSGSTTTDLTLNNLTFSEATSYRAIASSTSGSVTSAVAVITMYSSMTDVTSPGDEIVAFGDDSNGLAGTANNPLNAIDNSLVRYENGGSGFNATAGFPPFQGPAGVIITPAMGSTLVKGLRIYCSEGNTERDPADYKLEGSNDGGTNYTLISSGAVSLPLLRGNIALALDPLAAPVQEFLFSNTQTYTTYRLSVNNVRNNSTARSTQFGEIELLGVSAIPAFRLTIVIGTGGQLTLSSSAPGTLQSATALSANTAWQDEGPINGSVTITPSSSTPAKFYRVKQ